MSKRPIFAVGDKVRVTEASAYNGDPGTEGPRTGKIGYVGLIGAPRIYGDEDITSISIDINDGKEHGWIVYPSEIEKID